MAPPALAEDNSASQVEWEKTAGRRRPALWAAVLVGVGIIVGRYLPVPLLVWGALVFIALLAVLFLGRRNSVVLFVTTLGLWILLGAFRYGSQTGMLPANHVSFYLDHPRKVELFGRIVAVPDRRSNFTNLVLDLQYLEEDRRRVSVSDRILARVYDTTRHFSYGDFLLFAGLLEKPHEARNPGGFDYRRHLSDRGIYGVVSVAKNRRVQVYPDPHGAAFYNRLVIPLREYILAKFREYLPEVSAALLAGYLLGETRDMPDWLYRAYRGSGTLHLLAVSGSNVWLVLGLFWLVFRRLRFPRLVQTVLLLIILVVFCFITRNEPSVVRAGLMAALVLLGRLFYRRLDGLNIIGVSAVIILLFSPRQLFLPGFQLSYAAVLGIVIMIPRVLQLFRRLARLRFGRWLLTLIASSVAATVATAPILALHFGTIPVISVVANLVMVPLAALITNCAVVLVLLGDIWPAAARLVAWAADLLAGWSIQTARYFEAVPLGRVVWSNPGIFSIVNYMLLLVAIASSRYWFRWVKPAVFYGLLMGVVFFGSRVFSDSPPEGEVIFFDAGREPLVGLSLPGAAPQLVGTKTAFSSSKRQWVIEPYAVFCGWPERDIRYDTLIPAPTQQSMSRPVSVSKVECQLSEGPEGDTRHVRFLFGASPGPQRIAADYIANSGSQVLIVYNSDPEVLNFVGGVLPRRRVDVLAMISCLPSPPLKKLLDGLTCDKLILFGGFPHFSADRAGEAWARELPNAHVWTTRKSGGIRISLSSPVGVFPTLR